MRHNFGRNDKQISRRRRRRQPLGVMAIISSQRQASSIAWRQSEKLNQIERHGKNSCLTQNYYSLLISRAHSLTNVSLPRNFRQESKGEWERGEQGDDPDDDDDNEQTHVGFLHTRPSYIWLSSSQKEQLGHWRWGTRTESVSPCILVGWHPRSS